MPEILLTGTLSPNSIDHTQLSMKFKLLTKPKMLKSKDISCFQTLRCSYMTEILLTGTLSLYTIHQSCSTQLSMKFELLTKTSKK